MTPAQVRRVVAALVDNKSVTAYGGWIRLVKEVLAYTKPHLQDTESEWRRVYERLQATRHGSKGDAVREVLQSAFPDLPAVEFGDSETDADEEGSDE